MDDDIPKRCPLNYGGKCDEKNCAWWNRIDEECCVATLGALARLDIKRREG